MPANSRAATPSRRTFPPSMKTSSSTTRRSVQPSTRSAASGGFAGAAGGGVDPDGAEVGVAAGGQPVGVSVTCAVREAAPIAAVTETGATSHDACVLVRKQSCRGSAVPGDPDARRHRVGPGRVARAPSAPAP